MEVYQKGVGNMTTISWLGLDATPVMTGRIVLRWNGVTFIEWDIDPAFFFRVSWYPTRQIEAFVRMKLMEVKDETHS